MVGGESILVFLILIMKFTDGFNTMTAINQFMSPTSNSSIVRVRIVPVAVVVCIFACG
jgi:hypothetical protein